jgi:hypothetical protein
MRKIISLGLFALMLSIFSGQALAGDKTACEDLKDRNLKDYAPNLYGPCVAWHNADENAKDRFADNYRRKSGGDDVPGSASGMACPCWAGVVLEDVGKYTPAESCYLNTTNGDFMFFSDAQDFNVQSYATDGINCIHEAAYTDDSGTEIERFGFVLGLDAAGQQACTTEIEDLENMYFDNDPICIVFP